MLTSKQRAYLRSLAQTEKAIFQIGKGGINEELINQLDDALRARELIKVRVLSNSLEEPKEAGEILAKNTQAELVQVVGNVITLYRAREKEPEIILP